MLVQSAAAAAAARQQNLPLRRLLCSTALSTVSACHTSLRATAPALRRHITSDQNPRPLRRKSFRSLAGVQRQLATAVEEYRPDPHFEVMPRAIYELRPMDPSSALVITDRAKFFPGQVAPRRDKLGLPNGIQESLCVFDACIQVGRLERAAQVLKRLLGSLPPTDEIELHDRFLEARLVHMQHVGPDTDPGDDLHQWFEVQIRSRDLPYTHDTIALLLKASLIGSPRSLNLRVKRYMSMLEKETALETLYIGGLLDPAELTAIAQICPEYNYNQGELEERHQLGAEAGEVSHLNTLNPDSRPVPHVLVTPQKGVGLKVLRQTLAVFDEIPQGGAIHSLPTPERREIQIRLEQDCVDGAIKRWREENQNLLDMGRNPCLTRRPLATRLYEWHTALEARLIKEINLIDACERTQVRTQQDQDRCSYGPFLRLCSPSRLAAATILSSLSSLSMAGIDKGVPLSNLVAQIAQTVEEEIRVQNTRDQMEKEKLFGRQTPRWKRTSKPINRTPTATADADEASETASGVVQHGMKWTTPIRMQVGCALFQALMETAKMEVVREHPETKALVTQVQPAFNHTMQLKRGKKVGMVMANPELVNVLKSEPHEDYLARLLPMVVEPEPWTKFDKGGYLMTPTALVRVKNGEVDQKIYTEAALARGDMDQVLKGLDVLGKTAWRINKSVLHVMLEAWNQGDAIANIPALHPVLNIPPEPESNDDPGLRAKWVRAVKAAEGVRSGLHSERCHMNLQLEIARAFRDQSFYFPHNIDFRGRAYPIPAYLNHMGADHVRGLLCFAKGKALGEEGLRWLKVHLANVYGFDKASLSERENFAVENLDNIRDSAANPLTGKRWWLEAEDPWQCLAACFEFAGAMELPDPTQYISYLPVHQDGTCNGLQHYAALGGDTWGAQQVNLVPGDRPADVYSAVARQVEALIAKDAEDGLDVALELQGKITRKVVKQTVMTNVYGVTFVGAKRQVERQLRDLYPDLVAGTASGHSHFLASYITKKIFASLKNMFRGAHDIQEWLGEIGARVCMSVSPEQMQEIFGKNASAEQDPKAEVAKKKKKEVAPKSRQRKSENPYAHVPLASLFRSSVVWTTPLRMPVVQPYRQVGTTAIKTCIQDLTIMKPEPFDPVNKRKQLQGFPPNFIHSLDASHMLLSALECDEQGLTFAAVHDSFWTHACDVAAMSKVLRDAFVRIHGENVIGRLHAEFQARYKGHYYLARLKADAPVAKRVDAFRKSADQRLGLLEELQIERERRRLLQSSDPAEVQKAQEMVTPTTIYEAYSDALDVVSEFEAANEAEESANEAEGEHEGQKPDEWEADIPAIKPGAKGDFTRVLNKTKAQAKKPPVEVWVPLTFPDIPQKGDFDVKMLLDSKYFFS